MYINLKANYVGKLIMAFLLVVKPALGLANGIIIQKKNYSNRLPPHKTLNRFFNI